MLFIFLTEDREVDVALRMLTEVDNERVGIAHGRAEVVVESGVVHEQSQGAFVAVELVGELLHVGNGLVYLLLCGLQVECREVGG